MKISFAVIVASIFLSPFAWASGTCPAALSVWKNTKIDGFERPFDANVDFDERGANLTLAGLGYNLVGTRAYKYQNNVAVYISIDERLRFAKVSYRRWANRTYRGVAPSFGDILIVEDSLKALKVNSFEDAVALVLRNLRTCDEILRLSNR